MSLNFKFQSFKESVPQHNQSLYYFGKRYGLMGIKEGYAFYIWRDDDGCEYDYDPRDADDFKECKLLFCIQNEGDCLSDTYCEVSEVSKQFPDIYWIDLKECDDKCFNS